MIAAPRARAFAPIFLVAAFGVALSCPAGAQKAGGTITVGLELDIPGFDPLKVGVYDTAALTASSAIFDSLTYLDANGKAQPKLALSWEPSEDFKTWTIKLRPGVSFSGSLEPTIASIRFPERTSLTSLMERSCPTASGVSVSG